MAHLAHYREAHPLVFVITHWINLVAMVMLILTRAGPPRSRSPRRWCARERGSTRSRRP